MSFSNRDDTIDTRDIILRRDELESALDDFNSNRQELLDTLQELLVSAEDHENESSKTTPEGIKLGKEIEEAQQAVDENAEEVFEDQDELDTLRKLLDDVSNYASDWEYGTTLIHRFYWVEYVEELCKEIGDIPSNIPSYIEIDWEKTADNIEQDYTTVDFDGEEYLVRCS